MGLLNSNYSAAHLAFWPASAAWLNSYIKYAKGREKAWKKVPEADLVKRVKAFILNDNYAGALAVVKGVDAGRIKNPPILCLIGEVYMHENSMRSLRKFSCGLMRRSPKIEKFWILLRAYILKWVNMRRRSIIIRNLFL